MHAIITSPQNPRLKNVMKLRDRRPRKQQGLFLIDGARQIGQAIRARVAVREVYLPQLPGAESHDELIALAHEAGAEIVEVAQPAFAKVAYGDRVLEPVAVAVIPSFELAMLPALPEEALIAVVEGIEKPGNLGAMLRTADAAGCQALLVADSVTDITNPNVIRASMGAVFTVPLAQADSPTIRRWLEQQQFAVFAARVDGSLDYAHASYRGKAAIVLGSEAGGLGAVWQGAGIQAVRLPMRGTVDSLNVSVTAAVLLYEAQRQRRIR